jgi:hypothetical protein
MKDYQRLINKVLAFAKRADDTASHCTGLDDKVRFQRLAKQLRGTASSLRLEWFEVEDMLQMPTVR